MIFIASDRHSSSIESDKDAEGEGLVTAKKVIFDDWDINYVYYQADFVELLNTYNLEVTNTRVNNR